MRTKSRNVRSDERKQQLQRLHFVVLRNVFPRSEGKNAFVCKCRAHEKVRIPTYQNCRKNRKIMRLLAEERVSPIHESPVKHGIASDALDIFSPVLKLLNVGLYPGHNIL